MEKNKINIDDLNDFGFSFDDSELVKVKEMEEKSEDLSGRIDTLVAVFNKFLDNLSENPDQKTLVWPNRIEKIEQFRMLIKKIAEGEID